MKRTSAILAISVSLAILCSCSSARPDISPEDVSWQAFCRHTGCDDSDISVRNTDLYNDTWRGSVHEEEALLNAGVKPY